MLGFQVPPLVNSAQLQAQVDAAAKSYAPAARPSAIPAACRPEPCSATRPAGAAGPGPVRRGRHAGRSGDHRPGPQRPGGHRGRGGRRRRHGRRVLRAIAVPAGPGGGQRTPRPGDRGHRGRPSDKGGSVPTRYGSVLSDGLAARRTWPQPAVGERPGTGRLRLCPGAIVARVHQPHPRLGRAASARRGPAADARGPSRCSSPSCRSACCSGCWPHAASSAGYAAWNEPPSRSPTATTPSPCPSPAGTRSAGWKRTSPP